MCQCLSSFVSPVIIHISGAKGEEKTTGYSTRFGSFCMRTTRLPFAVALYACQQWINVTCDSWGKKTVFNGDGYIMMTVIVLTRQYLNHWFSLAFRFKLDLSRCTVARHIVYIKLTVSSTKTTLYYKGMERSLQPSDELFLPSAAAGYILPSRWQHSLTVRLKANVTPKNTTLHLKKYI